jgi:CRISPR-associated protein Csm3
MTTLSSIEFKKRVFISGTLTVLTGLHIGGNSTEMSIGGADHIVVRDPLTNHPYIPGSSLRGKMRSLLERLTGEMTIKLKGKNTALNHIRALGEIMADGVILNSAGPSTDPSQLSTRLFGLPIDKQNGYQIADIVPQRLVVRDARLMNPARWKKLETRICP